VFIIPPSIDALSEKNMDLPAEEVVDTQGRFGIDPERPLILQVSRFDRFKDPLGVIRAYELAKRFVPTLQLGLAGGEAADDPEGASVLEEVREAAADDPDIHVLMLPANSNRTINALQRAAVVGLQKSLREGFGLTVTESMWKGKPVIGGNVGGIRLQVVNHETGFLVDTPEGAALRIRYLLFNEGERLRIGRQAKEFVRENFLITRNLREYLTLIVALSHGADGRIEL
jgi:trehalose synthase